MGRYIMAMDAGTTSNRCILFTKEGTVAALSQKEFKQIYPQPGWVEHDPEEILSTMLDVAREAMEGVPASASDIAGIGITNQRETTIIWDKATGKPVYNAIVWQCRRTAEFCDVLKAEGLEDDIRERTGLVVDAYFSATKIRWILDHVEGVRERAERGELLFGTVETWLIWNLTGGKVHVTDYSNASRTMLFNLKTLTWDEDILRELEIPASILPEAKPSSCIYGKTKASLFGEEIPVAGAGGDQQCALFGQGCVSAGGIKSTYGTGGFLLMHTGDVPVFSERGLLTTIACTTGDKAQYALEGSIFVAGAAIQWLRDEMRLIDSAPESEALARAVPDTNGCVVVPAFTGLGAPHWDAYARGTILGLTRGVNRNHVIRATLESLAYQVTDVIDAMKKDVSAATGKPSGDVIEELLVDGGAAKNDLLMQMQADLTGVPVLRPSMVETTALGAAYLAGLATGFFEDTDVRGASQGDMDRFEPGIDDSLREEKLRLWHKAVSYSKGWMKE